jgi:hypothetical protein
VVSLLSAGIEFTSPLTAGLTLAFVAELLKLGRADSAVMQIIQKNITQNAIFFTIFSFLTTTN